MNRNKILLVNPPFARLVGLEQDYVPLALWHISTLLKQQGFDPYIKNLNIPPPTAQDNNLHYVDYLERTKKYGNITNIYGNTKTQYYKELNDAIKAVKPDMIGFTVLTPQIRIVNDLISHVKTTHELPIFCGGAGVTLNFIKIIGCNLLFLGGINTNNLLVLNHIKDYEETIIHEIPFDLHRYEGNLNFDGLLDSYSPEAYGHVFSSIGCYANCRFCSSPAIWHRRVYFKSTEAFVNELTQIANRHHPKSFHIWDENFTTKSTRIFDFCGKLKKTELTTPWECDSRIDSLDERKVALMKEYGCFQVAIGAESGCQKTLDYLNKGIVSARIKSTIDLLNKYKLKSKVYMIMGFPEETYKDMLESIDFIKSCKPTAITLSLFTPYQHTSLYDECIDKGLIDSATYDESNHSHQSGTFLKQIHPEIDITGIIKDIDDYNKDKDKDSK
jgi:radical SAM superfamily enzyme YgiQ (UPF0313 family)